LIPLYKLEKLPRIQRLRKIAKFFSFAENRLSNTAEKSLEIFSVSELVFFSDAAKLLSNDEIFSIDSKKMFNESAGIFRIAAANQNTATSTDDIVFFRRALNNIKHILLSETGRDQADWDFTCSDGNLDPQKRKIFEGMWVYMEDIRSPFNVGAMFRTAESFGVEKIILSPFCADPHHRRAQRTSMGCIDIIPWERDDLFPSPETSLDISIPIFALETGGIPLADFQFPKRGLLIVGSEELGVSPLALAAADASLGRVSIPCYGAKASLNVSVAFGIAMQNWAK
jgi:TrmH family RNA methyltransferase